MYRCTGIFVDCYVAICAVGACWSILSWYMVRYGIWWQSGYIGILVYRCVRVFVYSVIRVVVCWHVGMLVIPYIGSL